MRKIIYFLTLFILIFIFFCFPTENLFVKNIFSFVPPPMFTGPSYQLNILYNKKPISEPFCAFLISGSNNKLSKERKIEICNNYILQNSQKQIQHEIMITKDGNNVVVNDCTNNNLCRFGKFGPFDTPKFNLSIYIPSSKKFLTTPIETQISEKDFGYVTQKYKVRINSDDSIIVDREIVNMKEIDKPKTNKSIFKLIFSGVSISIILVFIIFKKRNKKI